MRQKRRIYLVLARFLHLKRRGGTKQRTAPTNPLAVFLYIFLESAVHLSPFPSHVTVLASTRIVVRINCSVTYEA